MKPIAICCGVLTTSMLLVGCATARPRTVPPPAVAAPAPSSVARASVERAIAEPPFDHAVWGIRVEEDDGTVLYDHNGSTLLMPASNRKLFAAATALECLGADSRIETELWTSVPAAPGRLDGDLVVKGGRRSFVRRTVLRNQAVGFCALSPRAASASNRRDSRRHRRRRIAFRSRNGSRRVEGR
jgi:D-alanyl-D-alanine carboxypeptidase